MFDEELKEYIISRFEEFGFDFDYEEDAEEGEKGWIKKTCHFSINLGKIKFCVYVVITFYGDAGFSDILYVAPSEQLKFNKLEMVEYLNLLKKTNESNYLFGVHGSLCFFGRGRRLCVA